MNEEQLPRRIGRSLLALFAGEDTRARQAAGV